MIKETDNEGTTKYTYVKCPACGSKKRHYEHASEKAIKMGIAEAGFLMPYMHDNRAVVDPRKDRFLPTGTEAPTVISATEICMECGCVYAPMVIQAKGKKIMVDKQGKNISKPIIHLPGQN